MLYLLLLAEFRPALPLSSRRRGLRNTSAMGSWHAGAHTYIAVAVSLLDVPVFSSAVAASSAAVAVSSSVGAVSSYIISDV